MFSRIGSENPHGLQREALAHRSAPFGEVKPAATLQKRHAPSEQEGNAEGLLLCATMPLRSATTAQNTFFSSMGKPRCATLPAKRPTHLPRQSLIINQDHALNARSAQVLKGHVTGKRTEIGRQSHYFYSLSFPSLVGSLFCARGTRARPYPKRERTRFFLI